MRAEVAAHSAAAVLAPLAVGFWDAVALADGHADLVRVREWVGIIAQAYRVRVGVRIRVGVRVYRVRARARTIGLGLGGGPAGLADGEASEQRAQAGEEAEGVRFLQCVVLDLVHHVSVAEK